ncbi:GTP cyclohydrolase N terminal-domain-containing protein [Schizothecium vesticola]|uniref:GTP cyclohydrolase N terminal-domain-containing protein n=1 Tax=Schizothecium vesticola TaxID=314040 RepID=A0AA40FBM8_9PEZI|nr:GTP cyclohydrolase N terminal-domain-containing protein [Schizothecium vesticola]
MTTGMDEVRDALKAIAEGQARLLSVVSSVSKRVDDLETESKSASGISDAVKTATVIPLVDGTKTPPLLPADAGSQSPPPILATADTQSGFSSRIILTTYPKQIGIKPLPMEWGEPDPLKRGPVTVSRNSSTIRRRNAIGAHGGSYSIYYALAVASKELAADHVPDFTNTEPAVNIGPFPQWGDKKKIVGMDPWGHMVPWLFKDIMDKDNSIPLILSVVDLRPTIAITKAHMKLSELEDSVRSGRLVPDGKVCINAAGELAVTKFAVEPVWYLPGVAERFGIDEGTLRRSLFEHTGGMYPELITRGDIKVFLPPIGGLTVYVFGDPANMSDPSKRLALRIHDECNGSDVFGSDICTCRPYLIFGIEEAVKEAQNGGSGVVIYFRKEGRALGEVTKRLAVVYNARKRGEDRASDYFKRTENIAGVKDMRFQALMPDILHWLGITKIDRMLSMSNMKHDAIVGQGIPIHERVELPESWIPADSRVEIDAKITAGYFTTGHRMTADELKAVQGRIWEE